LEDNEERCNCGENDDDDDEDEDGNEKVFMVVEWNGME
jgi:hypothetical protein